MTGPEHYQEAERLAVMCVDSHGNPPPHLAPELGAYLSLANVHAVLALAAATAMNDGEAGMDLEDLQAWEKAVSARLSGSDGS
ncbi:hypothetical protein [Actinocrispum wychmicini]|uniref:Uncharacterized protein n=1 Tax=Actinocrispum wychmicini TaxID=1213861 RepID=A0A4R2JWN9_9PSEU|nr:hypothetical protein [Actinocrispum wychmicini]TCO64921.1 hypothetical protein EV192_101705 [Actinocrispum wychmicini]